MAYWVFRDESWYGLWDAPTQGSTMNLKVLLATSAMVDRKPAELGRPLQRAILVMLVAADGQVVTVEQIRDRLWDGKPAETASEMLYRYIGALRKTLRERPDRVVIPLGTNGYRIMLRRDEVDLHRFRDGVIAARSEHDVHRSAALFRAALAEWGSHVAGMLDLDPLTGLPGRWMEGFRWTLKAELETALLSWIEAEPSGGHMADACVG